MERPPLNLSISVQDFRDFYWLKEELLIFCKAHKINTSGSKIELSERIIQFLQHGQASSSDVVEKEQRLSSFDWNHANLSEDTIITDNYKNTENVRRFFLTCIGKHFRFNVAFMNWMKTNIGKTLGDATAEWKRIAASKKDNNLKTEIAPQFEYNRYIRAFLAANPDKTIQDAMRHWKIKRQERGSREYNDSDLNHPSTAQS